MNTNTFKITKDEQKQITDHINDLAVLRDSLESQIIEFNSAVLLAKRRLQHQMDIYNKGTNVLSETINGIHTRFTDKLNVWDNDTENSFAIEDWLSDISMFSDEISDAVLFPDNYNQITISDLINVVDLADAFDDLDKQPNLD